MHIITRDDGHLFALMFLCIARQKRVVGKSEIWKTRKLANIGIASVESTINLQWIVVQNGKTIHGSRTRDGQIDKA